jgi:hypothetical protein
MNPTRNVSNKSIASTSFVQKSTTGSTEAALSQEISVENLNEIKSPYVPADATEQEKRIH